MNKKILVIGVSGLTGYKIANILSKNFETYGTFNQRPISLENVETLQMDITSKEKLSEVFSNIEPNIVINTSALHNVDYCEVNAEEAFNVNYRSVENIEKLTNKYESKLIHFSTDYVFDGENTSPYSEKDNPNPLSVYGLSKLKGENSICLEKHVVIRPSVVYGWSPMELTEQVSSSGKAINFALWLLKKLKNNEKINIVTDQITTATLADSLAESMINIIQSNKSGLYHMSGLSCETRYEFAIKLCESFGYDPDLISPTTSSAFSQKAKRPKFSCLDCNKAISTLGITLLSTEKSLQKMKEQIIKDAPQLIKS